MRHHPTPGAFWLTGREDECAVSEALPMPRCSSCLPACFRDPGLPAGEQPVLGNTASSPSALLRQHFPSLSLLYSPAGTQPLLGEPSPLTMGPAAAHGADCPLWDSHWKHCGGSPQPMTSFGLSWPFSQWRSQLCRAVGCTACRKPLHGGCSGKGAQLDSPHPSSAGQWRCLQRRPSWPPLHGVTEGLLPPADGCGEQRAQAPGPEAPGCLLGAALPSVPRAWGRFQQSLARFLRKQGKGALP